MNRMKWIVKKIKANQLDKLKENKNHSKKEKGLKTNQTMSVGQTPALVVGLSHLTSSWQMAWCCALQEPSVSGAICGSVLLPFPLRLLATCRFWVMDWRICGYVTCVEQKGLCDVWGVAPAKNRRWEYCTNCVVVLRA